MNIGHRIFIVAGDSVIRLSQKKYSDFFFREEPALPDYAGTSLVVAAVIYELKNRKPDRVIRIDVMRLKVSPDGSLDRDHLREGMRLAMDRGFGKQRASVNIKATANVVDATELFDERRWKQHHPEISGPALKKILTDLFGSSHSI